MQPPAGGWPPEVGDWDASLLDAVLDGNAGAFAELFTRHARLVFSFCGRRSGDWGGAEDLTSVVFLEAWRSRQRAFLVQGSLRPWLLGIAAHVVANSRRSLHRHQAALQRFAVSRIETADSQDVAAEATRLADLERTGRVVSAALDRLPRDQRDVAELCLLGELSVAAAAQALGVPGSTVRSRLENARAGLRRLLRSRDVDRPSWLIGDQQGERRPGATDGLSQVRTR